MVDTLIHIFFRKHIFIALCAVSFFLSGYMLAGGTGIPGLARVGIIFMATLFVYQFNTTGIGIAYRHPLRDAAKVARTRDFRFFAATGLLVLLLSMFITWGERLILLCMAILSLLYNPPLDRGRFFFPLRDIPFLKIFLISIVWAMLGSLYPWSVLGFEGSAAVVLRQFSGMFFFVHGITLPFDIRDAEHDKNGGLPTMVHLFDAKTTRIVGVGAVFMAGVLLWPLYPVKTYLVPALALAAALVYGAGAGRHYLYYQGLLDGTIPALYLATLLSLNVQMNVS